ncbi:MAG: NAD kinase [Pseudomonadota bacterium]
MKLHFVSSQAPEAIKAAQKLKHLLGQAQLEDADVIVALGGDGLMLETVHTVLASGQAIFGMNRGSVGFLMNEFETDGLIDRIAAATETIIHPLNMTVTDKQGTSHSALAFNEVSMLRQRHQAAKLRVSIDGKIRLDELVCDGMIVATPAGSTAYNLSAHGPILPINSPLLALTPISPFRPRRWRGAILSHEATVEIEVLEANKRPVSAVADQTEFRDVVKVVVSEDEKRSARLLFDDGHSLAERVLNEQFQF